MKYTDKADPDIRSILDSLRRVVRALRVYSRESENHRGLSAAQLFVLQQLRADRPVALKELAARTMTDLSSVSVVVGRLARKGLLTRRRSTKDARALDIRLSAEGKRRLGKQPDALQSRLIQAAASLVPAKRKALASGLRVLLRSASLSGETPMLFFEPEKR